MRTLTTTILFFALHLFVSCADEAKNVTNTLNDSIKHVKVTPLPKVPPPPKVMPADSMPRSPEKIAKEAKIIKKQSTANPTLQQELQTLINQITTAKYSEKRKLTKQFSKKFANLHAKCISGAFTDTAKMNYTPKEYAKRLKLLSNITVVVQEVLGNKEQLITYVTIKEKNK